MKSKRITYLKTLQYLAKRWNARIELVYFVDSGWSMRFITPATNVMVSAGTFNDTLKYLYLKVKTELK